MLNVETICDVCGRSVDHGGKRVTLNGDRVEHNINYDVCDECAERIRNLCAEIRNEHDEKMWR